MYCIARASEKTTKKVTSGLQEKLTISCQSIDHTSYSILLVFVTSSPSPMGKKISCPPQGIFISDFSMLSSVRLINYNSASSVHFSASFFFLQQADHITILITHRFKKFSFITPFLFLIIGFNLLKFFGKWCFSVNFLCASSICCYHKTQKEEFVNFFMIS